MKNIQKLGAYLPETYQYFPIFTDIFTYNDTAFDTIFFIVAIISRYQNSKEYEISDNEIQTLIVKRLRQRHTRDSFKLKF